MAKTAAPTTTATPEVAEFDWKGYLAGKRFALDRKFEAGDVQGDPLLMACAKFYLDSDMPQAVSHPGIRQFVMDVASKSARWGLSPAQAKGVLNVAVGQINALDSQEEGQKPWDGTQTVHNGRFTIVLDGKSERETDAWVTLRVEDDFRENALDGAQMVSILVGPDNNRNYRGIGFLQGDRLIVWGKNKSQTTWISHVESLLELAKSDPLLRDARERYALESGNCSRCGRTLTVPKSISYGVGPDCRKILGIADDDD